MQQRERERYAGGEGEGRRVLVRTGVLWWIYIRGQVEGVSVQVGTCQILSEGLVTWHVKEGSLPR